MLKPDESRLRAFLLTHIPAPSVENLVTGAEATVSPVSAAVNRKVTWPHGKKFAFTVFDDTDRATLDNIRPIYSFLSKLGFRTTKSVWPVRGNQEPVNPGATCADRDYLLWLLELQQSGFEIGYHMTTYHTALREEIKDGLEKFRQFFGRYPSSMANHVGCSENVYWGDSRFTGLNRFVYNLLTGYQQHNKYRGHVEGDPRFWGDVCRAKIKYVRNWTFPDINTMKACPIMPYHDPKRPYVNYWFASSKAGNVELFNGCMAEHNQERLEREGGLCIIYTHFAFGFYENGQLNPRFKTLMQQLSERNGWFVPVTTLLDFLLEHSGNTTISDADRKRLERRWLRHMMWYRLRAMYRHMN